MMLVAALGMASCDEEELEDKMDVLISGAESIVRAGIVKISLAEWASLSTPEKFAFCEAGDKIRAEQAYHTALAIGNPEYQMELAGKAWGLDAQREFLRGLALEELLQATNRVGGPSKAAK